MTETEQRPKRDGLLKRGLARYYTGIKDSLASARLVAHSTGSFLQGGVFPAADALVSMNQDVATSVVSALSGDQGLREAAQATSDRMVSAVRFQRLVRDWGRELFGSATFANESTIAENAFFRLQYLPPSPTAADTGVRVFHSAGSIPYGDRIFRMLPEFNFYDRFLERGVGVYAMELKGDADTLDYSSLTMAGLVDSIANLSGAAFDHHGGRLVFEGYCGHGTQGLAYLAARPAEATARFSGVVTFVSPIDGSRCSDLALPLQIAPKSLLDFNMQIMKRVGSYVPPESTQMGLDMGLEAVFPKTPFGYFFQGWQRHDFARLQSIQDLSAKQRRELAGTYWVSSDCARRFPVPFGVMEFTSELFEKGLDRDGTLPFEYQGRRPRLRDIAEKTELSMVGFYGGRDPVVPDATAHCLFDLLGDRYRHVVHPAAGHISYVLSPRSWDKAQARAFQPNPVDLVIDLAGGAKP